MSENVLHKIQTMRSALEAIQEQHKPRRLYLLDGDTGGGYYFDTAEEALAEARSNPLEGYETLYFESASEIPFFEICEECGRIESEQLKEMGEGACYRESLYPCATRRLADQGLGGNLARTTKNGDNNE